MEEEGGAAGVGGGHLSAFSCVHVHMFAGEEERARGHERQKSEKRERERG